MDGDLSEGLLLSGAESSARAGARCAAVARAGGGRRGRGTLGPALRRRCQEKPLRLSVLQGPFLLSGGWLEDLKREGGRRETGQPAT